jgi:hypothetical protein
LRFYVTGCSGRTAALQIYIGGFNMATNPAYAQPGLVTRENAAPINPTSLIAPVPNGDQSISISAAGVLSAASSPAFTVPDGSIRADIIAPVELWVRFGGVPAVGTGEKVTAGTKIKLTSPEELSTVRFYVTSPCILFVQYYK